MNTLAATIGTMEDEGRSLEKGVLAKHQQSELSIRIENSKYNDRDLQNTKGVQLSSGESVLSKNLQGWHAGPTMIEINNQVTERHRVFTGV